MFKISRIVMLAGFVFLFTRWSAMDEKQKTYLKSLIREVPHLPGRYAV